ncbi:asparagine synthase-related protein [Endothiovibrio diazotrophicus]
MFAGLFARFGASPPTSWIDPQRWLQRLHPFLAPDLAGHWSRAPALLVESQRFNLPWSSHATQAPWREGALAVAFWGRLDNRAELARQVGVDAGRLATLPDAPLVAAAWRRWGEGLPERLLGDFALAVVDTEARTLFLARDPLGVKPLYYWPSDRGLLFATAAAALRGLEGLEPTPDLDWMARYLVGLSKSHERTGYREIRKLPAGHCLVADGEGRTRLRRWHAWRDDAPPAVRRDPQWLEAYGDVLDEAIRCRVPSDYPLGSENSGGVDSSTVIAYLARELDDPAERLHGFGFAYCEREPAFILENCWASGIRHNYLITAPEAFDGVDSASQLRGLQVLGYPEEHGDGTGYAPFYQECGLRGIRTLFSGFGGDEVVTNPGSQLRMELLDRHAYGALWGILPGNPLTRLLRLGKAATLGRRSPDYRPDFLRTWTLRWPHQALRPEVVERLGLHREYLETARYDAPYRRINQWIVDGLLQMPYIPTRLENSTLVAASYGVDYRWPLWDVRLVQQYLSTPSIEKVGPGGVGRYLHRRAIDGTVPRRAVWASNKDMGYAAPLERRHDRGVVSASERARRHEARLHPALEELLDREKWREQIERAARGKVPADFRIPFRRTSRAVRWLNHWLYGEPVD